MLALSLEPGLASRGGMVCGTELASRPAARRSLPKKALRVNGDTRQPWYIAVMPGRRRARCAGHQIKCTNLPLCITIR